MKITKKELKTIIHIEISYEEFVDNLANLKSDFCLGHWICHSHKHEEMLRSMTEEEMNKEAEQIFTSSPMSAYSLIADEVARYIAKASGWDVCWFGYYDRHTKKRYYTLERYGDYI